MPCHKLNVNKMGEVQRMLQSNENVNLEDGVQVHLIHIGMLHGGAAV